MARKERKPVIRAWSIGKCPTGEELRVAWTNARRSQKDFIWLLSVLGELDCFTDFTLEHKGGFGNIGGRRGGLKDFLAREAPELLPKYKTLARHMKLATDVKKTSFRRRSSRSSTRTCRCRGGTSPSSRTSCARRMRST